MVKLWKPDLLETRKFGVIFGPEGFHKVLGQEEDLKRRLGKGRPNGFRVSGDTGGEACAECRGGR